MLGYSDASNVLGTTLLLGLGLAGSRYALTRMRAS